MNYLVLARKYRPHSFSEVVGQKIIIETLKRALSVKKISHAFLFAGARGVGKTTVARLLAKALLCENGVTSDSCQICFNCIEINNGSCLDVIEIDAASNTGVDSMRDLLNITRYQPVKARYKIFIVDEIHMLSINAFNALLKTLEEPPLYVKFILATTEVHKIPATILSRCQRYDFKKVTVKDLFVHLKNVAKMEQISIDEAALSFISKNADGSVRDSLSLLEQIGNFAGKVITLPDILGLVGIPESVTVEKTIDCLLRRDVIQCLDICDNLERFGFDLRQFLNSVLSKVRVICLSVYLAPLDNLENLTIEEIKWIKDVIKLCDYTDIQFLFDVLLETASEMGKSQHSKLVLELAFIKIINRLRINKHDENTEQILFFGKKNCRINGVKSMKLNEFIKLLSEKMPITAYHLRYAKLKNNVLEFNEKFHFSRIQQISSDSHFKTASIQVFGCLLGVALVEEFDFISKKENLKKQFLDMPDIKNAISIFGGDIKVTEKPEP